MTSSDWYSKACDSVQTPPEPYETMSWFETRVPCGVTPVPKPLSKAQVPCVQGLAHGIELLSESAESSSLTTQFAFKSQFASQRAWLVLSHVRYPTCVAFCASKARPIPLCEAVSGAPNGNTTPRHCAGLVQSESQAKCTILSL